MNLDVASEFQDVYRSAAGGGAASRYKHSICNEPSKAGPKFWKHAKQAHPDTHLLRTSFPSMAISIDTALHHLKAPTSIKCGISGIWSMENGVPLGGTFGDIPIHRTNPLPGPNVRGMTLEDGAMVRARDCMFHTYVAGLVLHTACAGCLRALTLQIMVLYGNWVYKWIVC